MVSKSHEKYTVLQNVPLSRPPVRVEHASCLLLHIRMGIVVHILYGFNNPLLQVGGGAVSEGV